MKIHKRGTSFSYKDYSTAETITHCRFCREPYIVPAYVALMKKLDKYIPDKYKGMCCGCYNLIATHNVTVDDLFCCGKPVFVDNYMRTAILTCDKCNTRRVYSKIHDEWKKMTTKDLCSGL